MKKNRFKLKVLYTLISIPTLSIVYNNYALAACLNAYAGSYICSGTDTNSQYLSVETGDLSVTTLPDYSVVGGIGGLPGDGLNLVVGSGGGSLTLDQQSGSSISSSSSYGISATNIGSGSTNISLAGDVYGLYAALVVTNGSVPASGITPTDLTFTQSGGTIASQLTAASITNEGIGSTNVTINGKIIGGSSGISVYNGDNTTDLVFTQAGGSIVGEYVGIYTHNSGTGSSKIIITGDVVGGNNNDYGRDGINAYNRSSATDLTISQKAGIISGKAFGISAANKGSGVTEITTAGVVEGGNAAIIVTDAALGKAGVTITEKGEVRNSSGKTDALAILTGGEREDFPWLNIGDFRSEIHNAGRLYGTVQLGNMDNILSNTGIWDTSGGTNEFGTGSSNLINNGLIQAAGKNGSVVTTTFNNVTRFINNTDGSLSLNNGVAGDKVILNGNYTGNGGTILFDTVLGDDNSPTDHLEIKGDTSGTSFVQVNNAGGSGSQLYNGIELISVSGNSAGEFLQKGRIVAGNYDYTLSRGKGDNAKNWYLTNELTPVEPGKPDIKVIRPEAGGYSANLYAANNLFNLRLQDRQGENYYTDFLTGEKKSTSMWLRSVTGYTKSGSDTDQLQTRSHRNLIQLGGDILQWSGNGNDRYHLGMMAGSGRASGITKNRYSEYRAESDIDGYSAGLYGTWYADPEEKMGLYVDTWVQYAWFNNSVKGDDLAQEKYRSKGLSASVESGYTLLLGESLSGKGNTDRLYIQPKGQLTYSGVKMNSHTEENGTRIRDKGKGNIQSRVGVRMFGAGHAERDNNTAREFQPFVEVNWLHNTQSAGVKMEGNVVNQVGRRDIGEIKAGLEGRLSASTDIWFNVAQQIGSGDFADTQGMLGIKVKF